MSDDFNSLLKEQEQLASKRYNFDTWWQDIAYRVRPSEAQFTTKSEEGEQRTERLFDSNAQRANNQHAAVLEDLLTPRTQTWHMLSGRTEALKEDQQVKEYLQRVNRALFDMRYSPRANFAGQKHSGYLSIGMTGNSFMFIDEEISPQYRGPRYMTMHMSRVWWAENHRGFVDRFYRRFPWSAYNAWKRFGEALPDVVKNAARDSPDREFEFIHCVRPNDSMKPGRLDFTGMAYESWYGCVDQRCMIERGGYRCFPAAIGRYDVAPNETYGRSPAMACWPAIMTINEQKKTLLRAGQKEVDPPLLLTEEGVLEAFDLRAGALNYGAISDQGTQLVQPLKIGANIPIALEMMQLERQDIDDSFLITIFRTLVDNPQMTATQVLEIAQQKGVLLAPIMGRQHSEDLGPLIEREIDICSRLPGNEWMRNEMPEALMDDGGQYGIEYTSPLAMAMRAQEAQAIVRGFEVVGVAAQIDPGAAMVLDVPAATREYLEITRVPAKLIRGKDKVDQMIADKEDQDAAEMVAQAAPGISQAALNAAKAEQLART